MIVSFGAAAIISLGLVMLLLVQVRNMATNLTILERNTLVEAAALRPQFFIDNPYDLGCYDNFRQIKNMESCNGEDWPIRPGASKFSILDEQKRQKEARSAGYHGRRCRAIKPFAGSVLPWKHGFSTIVSMPSPTQSRLKLTEGDKVTVCRESKRWAYGHKDFRNGITEEGWFPDECVRDIPR